MELIEKEKAIEIADGYCHYTNIPKELEALPSIQAVPIEVLYEIRYAVWEVDIPSPTVPEYREHHEQIQNILALIDSKIKEYTNNEQEQD